jgi:hypothetical protein
VHGRGGLSVHRSRRDRRDLEKRLERIVGPVPGKFQTGPPPGQTPRPYDHAAVAALQRDELATWRADNACERKYIIPVEAVVRAQYEAQFRQRNQALFRRVKPVPRAGGA